MLLLRNDTYTSLSDNIPEWMSNDVWTRNTTGCACAFDVNRHECACCYMGGCQCPDRDEYQCVMCGHEAENCGHGKIPLYIRYMWL